jgi:hypothetical protein
MVQLLPLLTERSLRLLLWLLPRLIHARVSVPILCVSVLVRLSFPQLLP